MIEATRCRRLNDRGHRRRRYAYLRAVHALIDAERG